MHPRPPFLPSPRHLIAVLGLALACLVVALVRFGAPATTASGGDPARVRRDLAVLLGDGAAHPVGSAAHAKVRDRLLRAWRELGIEPEVQSGWVVSAGRLVHVENVIAVLPGVADPSVPARAPTHVLLAAHYDSVPAGPGASDDLLAVAVQLEVARTLAAAPGPRPATVFLTSDGEELGLHGALLFAKRHPLRAAITRFVNLEARGTTGGSLLFEAESLSGTALLAYSRLAARPLTSSLFVRVYEQMPNDTDFSVFRRELSGMGVNFACIGAVQHYHTPLDSLGNVDERTLVHHLDNALAAVRALGTTVPVGSKEARDELLWIDLLGFTVLGFSRHFGEIFGVTALALGLGSLASRLRRRRLSSMALASGFVLVILGIVVAVGLTLLLQTVLRAMGALPAPFVATSRPLLFGGVCLAACGVTLAGALGAWRAGHAGLAGGVQLLWCILLAVALGLERCVDLPVRGTELVPILAPTVFTAGMLAMVGAVAPRLRGVLHASGLAALGVATLQLGPLALSLVDALGTNMLPAVVLVLALAISGVGPYAGVAGKKRFLFPLYAFLLGLGCFLAAAKLAPFTPALPHGTNVVLLQEGGATQWLAQHLPKPAPPVVPALFAEPELTVLADVAEGGGRALTVRVRSPRGAPRLTLRLEGALLDQVRVEGEETLKEAFPLSSLTVVPLPKDGLVIHFRLPLPGQVDATVEDVTFDLPPSGTEVRAARPAWASPVHDGDKTVVRRRTRL